MDVRRGRGRRRSRRGWHRRRSGPWRRRSPPTSSGRRAAPCPRLRMSSASGGSPRTRSMQAASSSALPGSNSRPAPVPAISSASPPVRAAISGAPPASASRATIPNGSYSDGMTTQPARWTRSRSLTSGTKPIEADDVADPLDVDLGLQLGQVAAPPGDDALDVGHSRPQRAHRPGEDLEALLVLHPPPREHQRRPRLRPLAGRPPRRVDAVGHAMDPLGGQLEPAEHLAGHEHRRGDDLVGSVGEPRLDGVDRARLTRRDAAAVLAPQRRVERRHERHVVQRGDRRRRPGALPVVGVDDVGLPVAELGGEADEVVVRRRRAGDEVVVGDPRQLGGRHAATRTPAIVGLAGPRSDRQHDDVVAGLAERPAQPVDMGRRAAGQRAGTPT